MYETVDSDTKTRGETESESVFCVSVTLFHALKCHNRIGQNLDTFDEFQQNFNESTTTVLGQQRSDTERCWGDLLVDLATSRILGSVKPVVLAHKWPG